MCRTNEWYVQNPLGWVRKRLGYADQLDTPEMESDLPQQNRAAKIFW
jgi:hypothetical protein